LKKGGGVPPKLELRIMNGEEKSGVLRRCSEQARYLGHRFRAQKEMWIRKNGKIVVVDGDFGYNGAKAGMRLMEGRKTLLTPEIEGRRALEDRVKGKSIFGRVVVFGVILVCVF
jgi:hypothetical protein